jgi:hypothetical protein
LKVVTKVEGSNQSSGELDNIEGSSQSSRISFANQNQQIIQYYSILNFIRYMRSHHLKSTLETIWSEIKLDNIEGSNQSSRELDDIEGSSQSSRIFFPNQNQQIIQYFHSVQDFIRHTRSSCRALITELSKICHRLDNLIM